MKLGVVCQSCGIEAPAKHVVFHQNIGALIMRFHKKVDGQLCKRCIHGTFWPMTGITLGIGWLGIVSIIVAPIYVVSNLINYLGALTMPGVPAGARQPQINEEIFSCFLHCADEVFQRVHAGETPDDVARSISEEIGATPGQVIKCMSTFVQHRQSQQAMHEHNRTGEFPVIQPPAVPPPLVQAM